MRTTLTLDEDVATRIADLARERDASFKSIVNDALRRGLARSTPSEPEFCLKPHAGKLRPGIDHRRLNELAWEPDELNSRP